MKSPSLLTLQRAYVIDARLLFKLPFENTANRAGIQLALVAVPREELPSTSASPALAAADRSEDFYRGEAPIRIEMNPQGSPGQPMGADGGTPQV